MSGCGAPRRQRGWCPCRLVAYCSRRCQRAHWPWHRRSCPMQQEWALQVCGQCMPRAASRLERLGCRLCDVSRAPLANAIAEIVFDATRERLSAHLVAPRLRWPAVSCLLHHLPRFAYVEDDVRMQRWPLRRRRGLTPIVLPVDRWRCLLCLRAECAYCAARSGALVCYGCGCGPRWGV